MGLFKHNQPEPEPEPEPEPQPETPVGTRPAWPANQSISEHLVRRMEVAVSRLEALARRLQEERDAEDALAAAQRRRHDEHEEHP